LIEKVPEVALDRTPDRPDSNRMVLLAQEAKREGRRVEVGSLVMKQRPDLAGLPMIMGDACHLTPSAADHLQGGSVALHAHVSQAAKGGTSPDPRLLYQSLTADGERHNKWLKPEAIPALQQILMAQNEAVRAVLVDQLAHIDGKRAGVALAQRALFDLNPDVRKDALVALARRPAEEYRQTLLDGLRYPWAVVADHAAEAIVALGLKDTVPTLLTLLDLPDPGEPYRKPGTEGLHVREMVRLNHLRNCLLCHIASLGADDGKVRGLVPPTNQPLTSSPGGGYGGAEGKFVRADVTYLRQDFSVPLPVKNHGVWPAVQRFDFLVRERPATPQEIHGLAARAAEPRPPSDHQKALFFALRELTGKDPGPTAEDWKRVFLRGVRVMQRHTGLSSASGIAADTRGRLFISDDGAILHSEEDRVKVLAGDGPYRGLTVSPKGELLACAAARVVAIDPGTGGVRVLAEKYKGKALAGPLQLCADRHGGVYFTDAAATTLEGPTDRGAVYYLSPHGTLTRLAVPLARPCGVAVSADNKMLYLLGAGSPEVMAYPLEGAGLPGAGKVLCRLDSRSGAAAQGGTALAVDGRGNLFVTNPSLQAVQVFNSQGARLGQAPLPEAPLACALGGEGGRTLFVTTRGSVFAVHLETDGVAVTDR
jgi:sugar lactone lactonase YvrE